MLIERLAFRVFRATCFLVDLYFMALCLAILGPCIIYELVRRHWSR